MPVTNTPASVVSGNVFAGSHARATGAMLTQVPLTFTSGTNFKAGISFDQMIANDLKVRVPSLRLLVTSRQHLGLSVDWSRTYATIGTRAQRVSQTAFLRLLARGAAYQLEAPTLWDVDFKTAVAQAELEDAHDERAEDRFVKIEKSRPGPFLEE